jgi:hypothetical protein
LHTPFENYRLLSGRAAFANTQAPQLPAAVARVAQAVIGLNDLLTLSASPPSPVAAGPWANRSRPPATGQPQPCKPAVKERDRHGAWTYDQLAKAYSVSGLYAEGGDGANTAIALFELKPWAKSDINTFQGCYGTKASVTTVKVDGGATGKAGEEATLDIETAIAMAPAAQILVYEAPGGSTSFTSEIDEYTKIIDDDRAGVISSSYGSCEPVVNKLDPGLTASENTLFQQAGIEGISVFADAGDSGSEACYQTSKSMKELAVQDPASQPYVTAVGGTDLTALGPPPTETVWNEAAKKDGAGGGGISSVWGKPAWQAGPGVISRYSSGKPCNTASGYCREVPDVSASADPTHGYVIFYQGKWTVVGGTSAATPLWAGLLADIDSLGPTTRAGFLNPRLYSLPAGAFNDIVSGNNDYTRTHHGLYPASSGYDMASGLGSPIGTKLAKALRSWTAYEAPMPPGDEAEPNTGLDSVACPSASRCVAVGDYYNSSGLQGWLVTGSGSSWRATKAPLPADAGAGGDLSSVACPSPSRCVAVGSYAVSGDTGQGLLVTGSGSSWKATRAPLPAGANASAYPYPGLISVACPSVSECVAVGEYVDSSGNQQGWLVTGSGSSWKATKAPLPAGAGTGSGALLDSVACPSASQCVAVGQYYNSSGNYQGLLLTGLGTSWTAAEAPLLPHGGRDSGANLNSVVCPSASQCVAAGGSGNAQGLLVTGLQTSWKATKAPLPANADVSGGAYLYSVVCPSASQCTAAGFFFNASNNNEQEGLLVTGTGSSWTAAAEPPPDGAYPDWPTYLNSVACTTTLKCAAVGDYSFAPPSTYGLQVTGAGSSWTATEAPLPANAGYTAPGANLTSVACAPAGECLAVGNYTTKSGYVQGLLATGPG